MAVSGNGGVMTGTVGTQEMVGGLESIDGIQEALRGRAYVADRALATALFLALRLGKPLLLEGEAGVGKTEVAKTLADLLSTDLIRLQCYEGLDVNHAVYEWNYAKQMLEIRLLEADGVDREHALAEIFGPDFLIKRPLLQAVEYTNAQPGARPVLLIDEIDRADEEFEAFLLELLSDFQITVPEIGTLKAARPPVVIITSNRTRELHDALKRRCLYHWIDYPSVAKEEEIIAARLPAAPQELAGQVARFMHELRRVDLYKVPGVAETLDWAAALVALEQRDLRPEIVDATLGAILKHQEDVAKVGGTLGAQLVAGATDGR
ncbi:MAG: Carbon monoxide oxidation accessory protein CoxD [uncultured Thermomicrobiales bacterium]|uniref:Carbon monoxide oxidation accessory protein CoxD n=1 Tax=uncultured Thermomicrobiales bacterium TaxID=1645740 RepID=A0A6J4UN33_9BACT|nr:MAG: Carbon monoxide oxidation accessory protein CoxD [uncultured Thermomicrobiales bacterium]